MSEEMLEDSALTPSDESGLHEPADLGQVEKEVEAVLADPQINAVTPVERVVYTEQTLRQCLKDQKIHLGVELIRLIAYLKDNYADGVSADELTSAIEAWVGCGWVGR